MSRPASKPANFRFPTDLLDDLESFVVANPDWSKTEALSVALHAFLGSTPKSRIAMLASFRGRSIEPAVASAPKSPKK